jgi:hypothetical protein
LTLVIVKDVHLICTFCFAVMTVQGNAGPRVDVVVKMDLVNLRTYHIEFDACSVSCYLFDVHVVTSLMCVETNFFFSICL